jgi:16S rRNA (adenine1518-N6/adenine1519-N6)-dimethyltransferase
LRLAPRVAHVTAVEIDRDMAATLAPRLPPNADLIEADFLELDISALFAAAPLRVAGNLPYNIASPILFRLIDAHKQHARAQHGGAGAPGTCEAAAVGAIRDATVMVQREVADRIEAHAGTGEYGVLAIGVQLHADIRRLLTLPPGAFRPPPKVHSAVIRLAFRPPAVVLRDERTVDAMVRSMFTQRRKTLGNALRPFASSRRVDARAVLTAAGLDPRRRPETLQLAELARLADGFVEGGP